MAPPSTEKVTPERGWLSPASFFKQTTAPRARPLRLSAAFAAAGVGGGELQVAGLEGVGIPRRASWKGQGDRGARRGRWQRGRASCPGK